MHPIAQEMNQVIRANAPAAYDLLSDFGRNIYMPKGIIVQGAEAKQKAHKYNATIGIAKEGADPMHLESVRKYFNDLSPTELFDYAPPAGLPGLRQAWLAKMLAENPALAGKTVSLPVVTNALTHGLMLAADLFLDRGDVVLIPDKLWDNYSLMFEVRYGATIRNFPLFDEGLTGFNAAALAEALREAPQKVVLLLNFPNNPTGYTPTAAEAAEIVRTVVQAAEAGKKILVICDDAYYGLNYRDDLVAGSIFGQFVGAHPNIVALKADGFTKEFYVWGFRVGFITLGDYGQSPAAYAALEAKAGACIRSSISNCSQPAQSVLLKMLKGGDYQEERRAKFGILKARADKVREVAYAPQYADCWDVYPFNSGYFMCLRVKGVDANALRLHALDQHGVGAIALGPTDLRIAFSCLEADQIEDTFRLIAQSIHEMRGG
ncbi:MAG: aminotransferase class I/II-fold pyridoxal phosphate-dependent enzyme [Chloroflexi bacterium]|nr:aminotransferase class I/II-fold pyridoxal phosphate-dependent enzyme [Chloroflexota bacterium]